jgi:hypothetical protein
MIWQRPYRPRPPKSCGECGFLAECGGLDGSAYAVGCFRRCVEHCQFSGCDLACPCLHLNFPDLLEVVGGLWALPMQPLVRFSQPGKLPLYVPQIDHGSGRDVPLEEAIVVIPLSALVGRPGHGKYDVRFSSPEALRERLKLRSDCKIIVSSVAPDQMIENFWESHVSREILPKLAALKLDAMTVPNYSFMLDVPRINSIYNLSRMFRMAERMSEAGIPTILHIQASRVATGPDGAKCFKNRVAARLSRSNFRRALAQSLLETPISPASLTFSRMWADRCICWRSRAAVASARCRPRSHRGRSWTLRHSCGRFTVGN